MARSTAKSIEKAASLWQRGRYQDAARVCDAVLAADPQDFDALHLSGLIKHQLGRSIDGLREVAAALRARPGSIDALTSYGVILEALERHEEALAAYGRALAMQAGNAILYCNRGNALKALGRYAEAVASYDRALELQPDLAAALHNRGIALCALDRYEEALASYDRLLALSPRPGQAQASTLNNRGTTLAKLKRYDEALAGFDQVLALCPDYVDALNNRGTVLSKIGRHEEALADYAKALQLAPSFAQAYVSRGNVLLELNRVDEALANYGTALRLSPKMTQAHISRGNGFMALNRLAEALASFNDAIAIEPENAEANFHAAITRLGLGDFRQGWRQYQYRWNRKNFGSWPRDCRQPMWQGDTDLTGKTIFLMAEQGMGDIIQFVRYAPLLAARGAKVLLSAHRPLVALLTSLAGVSQVIPSGSTVPHFDLYCPLLSLPSAFGTELATIPANVPYVGANDERIARWRARLSDNGRLRVGICWAASANGSPRRSLPLRKFAALFAVPDVDFSSLQKEVSADEAAILSTHGVAQLGQDFADFADTAAVIAQLDLVVSVCTSVAHLAGAMAKATAVLLPFAADFRWMLDRTDSPWYPTMRLYRQTTPGDWTAPLERLRQELAGVVHSRAAAFQR